ncbi:MAG: hypothetical protein ACE10D_08505 [Planctomycetota bacterium]
MARTVADFCAEIRNLLKRGKLKAARKTLEKAKKTAARDMGLREAEFELLLAEEEPAAAAEALSELARRNADRVRLIKVADAHLDRNPNDHVLRDALWEVCIGAERYDLATTHLRHLLSSGGVDAVRRAKLLADRKDEVGAAGIFLLASLGGVRVDRIVLGNRMVRSEAGRKLIGGIGTTLNDRQHADAVVHLMLAQIAHHDGDREAMLAAAVEASEGVREALITWSQSIAPQERLLVALRLDDVGEALAAGVSLGLAGLAGLKIELEGEGSSARAVRALMLLAAGKASNACRIFEEVARRTPPSAAVIVTLLEPKAGEWAGAAEAVAAVVGEVDAELPVAPGRAADMLLGVPEGERSNAWLRAGGRLLKRLPARDDLREALGLALIRAGDEAGAAALLVEENHLGAAKTWVEKSDPTSVLLRAAAELAEKCGQMQLAAEWMLRAGETDPDLLATMGERFGKSRLPTDTALETAAAMLQGGKKAEAAGFLCNVPLDAETGRKVDAFMAQHQVVEDPAFQEASFRVGLALGDGKRARRLSTHVAAPAALVSEARGHADSARVLAEILVAKKEADPAAELLQVRFDAGDEPRRLQPLVDSILKADARSWPGRLLRGRILAKLGRKADAVRDLRAIALDAPQIDDAFALLGELRQGEAGGAAVLGRADILLARKRYENAILELLSGEAPAEERLRRFETICKTKPELEAGHRGRAEMLVLLNRVSDAAAAHFQRFECPDGDAPSIATDLEAVARKALEGRDIQATVHILEKLPQFLPDGADRAIGVVGSESSPPLLILKSKLLRQLNRAEEAVQSLEELAKQDKASRAQTASALQEIIASGQARPDADTALVRVFRLTGDTPRALAVLRQLYEDDITARETVVEAGDEIVREADDADVRLFLGGVCLDMRDPRSACQHGIHARRVRPAARKDAVDLLRRCLEQDGFSAEIHFAIAEAYLAGDEADDAVRHFRSAVEADPSRAQAAVNTMEEAAPRSHDAGMLWLAVGATHAEFLGQHQEAVAACTKGLEIDPPLEIEVPLLLRRGDSHAELGEEDDAFRDFDDASHKSKLERRYYEFLRSMHRRRELSAAEEAREKGGSDFKAAAEACQRLITVDRADEAVKVAQRSLAAAPEHIVPRYLVGVALHAASRLDAAARALEAVRHEVGADTELGRAARMILAECHLDRGDREKARACLTEIEAVDAAYPGLATRRGALAPPANDPLAPRPLFVRPIFPKSGS